MLGLHIQPLPPPPPQRVRLRNVLHLVDVSPNLLLHRLLHRHRTANPHTPQDVERILLVAQPKIVQTHAKKELKEIAVAEAVRAAGKAVVAKAVAVANHVIA